MFLFIFESIGTSELILIGIVALIVFGPRKLPQMAKTIGKTMAEFKNATNEFKATWEKEANFDDLEKNITPSVEPRNSVEKQDDNGESNLQMVSNSLIETPTIKELSASEIAEKFNGKEKLDSSLKSEAFVEKTISEKQNWL